MESSGLEWVKLDSIHSFFSVACLLLFSRKIGVFRKKIRDWLITGLFVCVRAWGCYFLFWACLFVSCYLRNDERFNTEEERWIVKFQRSSWLFRQIELFINHLLSPRYSFVMGGWLVNLYSDQALIGFLPLLLDVLLCIAITTWPYHSVKFATNHCKLLINQSDQSTIQGMARWVTNRDGEMCECEKRLTVRRVIRIACLKLSLHPWWA